MKSYEITIVNHQEVITGHDDESVLEAMRRQSLDPMIHGCYGGGCGRCRIRVVSGLYVVKQKMSSQHISLLDTENDIVLACSIAPQSNICIKLL
jgi:ferredoxin